MVTFKSLYTNVLANRVLATPRLTSSCVNYCLFKLVYGTNESLNFVVTSNLQYILMVTLRIGVLVHLVHVVSVLLYQTLQKDYSTTFGSRGFMHGDLKVT